MELNNGNNTSNLQTKKTKVKRKLSAINTKKIAKNKLKVPCKSILSYFGTKTRDESKENMIKFKENDMRIETEQLKFNVNSSQEMKHTSITPLCNQKENMAENLSLPFTLKYIKSRFPLVIFLNKFTEVLRPLLDLSSISITNILDHELGLIEINISLNSDDNQNEVEHLQSKLSDLKLDSDIEVTNTKLIKDSINKLKELSNDPLGNTEQSAILALKFNSQNLSTQEIDKTNSNKLVSDAPEVVKSSARITNQKYLDNLISVLDVVRGYDNLYSDEEKSMIEEFISMGTISQILIARMFFRK